MTHAEETLGLPSASGLARIADCPGSWNLERTMPEEIEAPDADRESGIRIHEWLAKVGGFNSSLSLSVPALSDEESDIHDRCEKLAAKFCEEGGFQTEYKSEERLWIFDAAGVKLFSGKFDRLYVSATCNHAFGVVDFKTNRGEQEANPSNLQLRALAVLVAGNHKAEQVAVKIIAPWRKDEPAVIYDQVDLASAKIELLMILARAGSPTAPRIPSESACKFCRGKAVCQEALNFALQPSQAVGPVADGGLTPKKAAEAVAALPHEQTAAIWRKSRTIRNILDAVDAHLKSLTAEDLHALGIRRKPGALRTPIVDPLVIWNRLAQDYGVTRDQFLSALKLSKEPVEELLRAATGLKGKALQEAMEKLLQGCVAEVQDADRLEDMTKL